MERYYIIMLYKMKDWTKRGSYSGMSLVAHTGKTLLKVFARRLSECCERVEILPEEQSGFRSNRSTTTMMFVIRRLQRLARKKRIPLDQYVHFIDFTKANDSVHRTLLLKVLARFGMLQKIISVIFESHDGIRLDGRVCTGGFGVEQDLRQRCVLAPLLFNIILAAVINVALLRFKAKKRHHGRFGASEEENGGGGEQPAESVLTTLLRGML